jgi:HSP20 family protein
MSTFTRWPWLDEQFRWQDEVLRSLAPWFAAGTRSAGVFPPVNLYDDGESFLVRAELPGVKKEALEISAKADQLTLRGERVQGSRDAPVSHHRRETEGGRFSRTITLPQAVDADRISASFKAGVLEVVIPRSAQAQPRRIHVQ